jgi:hypothetical protein
MTYDPPSTAPHHALLDNLSQQSSLLTALFTHLSQPISSNPSPLAIPPIPSFPSTSSPSDPLNTIYAALAERERDLAGIVSRTYEHQAAYASLMRKRDEVSGLERRVRGLVKALERDRKELERMVQSGEEIRESIAKSEKGEWLRWNHEPTTNKHEPTHHRTNNLWSASGADIGVRATCSCPIAILSRADDAPLAAYIHHTDESPLQRCSLVWTE